MKKPVRIGVVIPVLNEIDNLKNLLMSLNNQSHPECIHMIVIAAGDEDITGYKKLSSEFSSLHDKIRVLKNNKKITPAALNIGVTECLENNIDVIQFFGAHSLIGMDFFHNLYIHITESPEIDIFNSGLQLTPAENTKERAIQLFTLSRLGRNWKNFNSSSAKGFITGIFAVRREVFSEIGLFDERFVKNQDIQFIKRALTRNFKAVLFPNLIYLYKVRSSITETLKQMFITGKFISLDISSTNTKHIVPAIFYFLIFSIFMLYLLSKNIILLNLFLFIMIVYLTAVLAESFRHVINEKAAVFLPVIFICSHAVYAAGTFFGLFLRIKRN